MAGYTIALSKLYCIAVTSPYHISMRRPTDLLRSRERRASRENAAPVKSLSSSASVTLATFDWHFLLSTLATCDSSRRSFRMSAKLAPEYSLPKKSDEVSSTTCADLDWITSAEPQSTKGSTSSAGNVGHVRIAARSTARFERSGSSSSRTTNSRHTKSRHPRRRCLRRAKLRLMPRLTKPRS